MRRGCGRDFAINAQKVVTPKGLGYEVDGAQQAASSLICKDADDDHRLNWLRCYGSDLRSRRPLTIVQRFASGLVRLVLALRSLGQNDFESGAFALFFRRIFLKPMIELTGVRRS